MSVNELAAQLEIEEALKGDETQAVVAAKSPEINCVYIEEERLRSVADATMKAFKCATIKATAAAIFAEVIIFIVLIRLSV